MSVSQICEVVSWRVGFLVGKCGMHSLEDGAVLCVRWPGEVLPLEGCPGSIVGLGGLVRWGKLAMVAVCGVALAVVGALDGNGLMITVLEYGWDYV